MLPASKEDILVKELRELREMEKIHVSTIFRDNMKEIIKAKITPDTTCEEGIVMDCSTTKSGAIVHITITDLKGKVLVDTPINPYLQKSNFCNSDENRITSEEMEARIYPHEIYVKLKSIIDGTSKIIVYDQKQLQDNLILWRLASTKVIEHDEIEPDICEEENDNLYKIIDISEEFAKIYGEVDIYGDPIPQSLYACSKHYSESTAFSFKRDMHNPLSRCQTILECYRAMEAEKKEPPYKNLEGLYKNNLALAVPGNYFMEKLWGGKITDGVVVSVHYTHDGTGNSEVTQLSITDMVGEMLFTASIHPYVVESPYGEDSMYPHEVYYEIKEILKRASYIVTYDGTAECMLREWGILDDIGVDENNMRRIEEWFSSFYGEMSPCRDYFMCQSLYTCAKILGYSRCNELNLEDTIYECKAIAYCYQKMLESC